MGHFSFYHFIVENNKLNHSYSSMQQCQFKSNMLLESEMGCLRNPLIKDTHTLLTVKL